MRDWLKKELRLITNWLNGAMLLMIQNLDLAMQAIRDNLPVVSSYLTPDILKYSGVFIMFVCVMVRMSKKPEVMP